MSKKAIKYVEPSSESSSEEVISVKSNSKKAVNKQPIVAANKKKKVESSEEEVISVKSKKAVNKNKKVESSEEEVISVKSKTAANKQPVITNKKTVNEQKSSSSEEESDESDEIEIKTLPTLYVFDTNDKERMWKCWVIDDTLHREHGLINGKHVLSERTFEGKSIGKKNETTGPEQAWMNANKEWTTHITKNYLPKKDDKEGQKMLKLLNIEKQKSGGHNYNSTAAISGGTARKTKNISRQKSDTLMVDTIDSGDLLPMKAQVWELEDTNNPRSVQPKVAKFYSNVSGTGKNLKLTSTQFYAQPKLDGIRCIIRLQKNDDNEFEVVMTSNSGKQFPYFKCIRTAVLKWLSPLKNFDDLLDGLDGELYATEFNDADGNSIPLESRFSTISSICGLARSNPSELEDQIQFHCFDLFDKSGLVSQTERFEHLDKLFKKLPTSCKDKIIKVETIILNNTDEVVDYHGKCAEKHYEGVMLRTFNLKYKAKSRSAELRKFKMFLDDEYEIVGTKLDKGVATEQFVWVLKTDEGNEFNCKPMGSKAEKLDWYRDRKKYIGKFVTVKFQELSDEKIPRFPICKGFRAGKSTD